MSSWRRLFRETFVVLKQSPRSFVAELDFVTTPGFFRGHGERACRGMRGAGPQVVITDLGMLRPDTLTKELTLVSRYEGVSLEQVRDATGWPLRVADDVIELAPPTDSELRVLRDLQRRTRAAHAVPPPLPVSTTPLPTVTTT